MEIERYERLCERNLLSKAYSMIDIVRQEMPREAQMTMFVPPIVQSVGSWL